MVRVQSILALLLFSLLGFVENGNATRITSSYVRPAFPSTDIPLDAPVLAPPSGYNAPQQVHITQGDYNGKAVIITWVTPKKPGSSVVKYGFSENKYEFVANGSYTNYSFYKYKSGFIHQCLLDKLKYNMRYYYKLGTGKSSRKLWFQTPPRVGPDVPYTFGIIGDLGQTYNSLSTLRHFIKGKGQAVLYLGDLSYADRYKFNNVGRRWDSWGRLVENSTAYVPWMWSIGNHEIEHFPYMDETTPFKNFMYRYPTPYLASNSTSPFWYSIRRASAHIIVLNSYSPFITSTPQWMFLKKELRKVNRRETPWLIVIMHVPLYSSNEDHFMEGESMRAEFEEWFIKYRVDVIFAGHVHAYERSYRFSNVRKDVSSGDCYPIRDRSAPLYITVGDGGNQEGLAAFFRKPKPKYSAFREASYGHSTLKIKNRTHAFHYWHRNQDGKNVVADEVVLHNQYWASQKSQRKLKKQYLMTIVDEVEKNK